jgi:hypothetical protein
MHVTGNGNSLTVNVGLVAKSLRHIKISGSNASEHQVFSVLELDALPFGDAC